MLVWPAAARQNLSTDYVQFYEPVGRNVWMGNGLSTLDGSFSALYPPGYPLCLAALFGIADATGLSEELLIRLFIALTGIASPVLVYLIATPWFNSRTAFWAAFLWMLYPFQIYLAKQPNPESPFSVLLLASLWAVLALWRPIPPTPGRVVALSVLGGVLLGAATLIRPITLFLPALLFLLAFVHQKWLGVRQMTPFLAAFVLVLLPWELAAHAALGKWIPVSTNGSHSMFDGLTFALAPRGTGQPLPIDEDVRALMRSVWDHRLELPTTGSMLQFVAGYASREPWTVVKFLLLKASRALYATNAQWYETQILCIQIPFLLLLGAGAGWAIRQRMALPLVLLAVALPLYFWSMALLVLPILRYLVPALALSTIPAAALLDAAWSRFVTRGSA